MAYGRWQEGQRISWFVYFVSSDQTNYRNRMNKIPATPREMGSGSVSFLFSNFHFL